MTKKPATRSELKEVKYTEKRWTLLEAQRTRASEIIRSFENSHIPATAHGSMARGDVTAKSDIDVFIPPQVSSFTVEASLDKSGIRVRRRLVVQATPLYAMKAHIEIDDRTSVSFPLMKLRRVEREFYRFGGEADLEKLNNGVRVPGVDKRLMLIEPTEKGHMESTVLGRETGVAKLLGISAETVLDRVRALLRRDHVGRTGVFIKRELSSDETFEMVLQELAKKNPAVRRRLTTVA